MDSEGDVIDSSWIKRESEIERLMAEIDSLKSQRLRLVRYLVYHYTGQSSSLDGAYSDAINVMTSNYPWPSLEWVAERLEIYDRTAREGMKTMIGPDPLPPVTDEELAKLRELCENTIKSGQFGMAVAARDLYRVVSEFQQLRANLKEMGKIIRGPGEELNQDG